MALVFYNSLTRSRQKLEAATGQSLTMYSCGPTVYHYAHVGNLRSFLFADTLFRTLKYFGYKPIWAMNITDVDDKTIQGTITQKGSAANLDDLKNYTQTFFEAFLFDLEKLNIDPQKIKIIKVTEAIEQIQQDIVTLLDKGFAYRAKDGSVYFDIEKYQSQFGNYGSLVGDSFLSGKKTGVRIKQDDYTKENLNDFALWKARDENDGQIFWPHPLLGEGRPGWHIECSAINGLSFKEKTVDFHTGGVDLIFPHHTNEMAQSQALNNQPLARFWLHLGHLLVEGQKMSKSLNNFYLISQIIDKGFSPLSYRYFTLQSGYGQTLNFTWESLQAADNARKELLVKTAWLMTKTNGKIGKIVEEAKSKFDTALADNLNTSVAIAVMWESLDNKNIQPADKLATVLNFDEVLGLGLNNAQKMLDIPSEIKSLAEKRKDARAIQDWSEADIVRQNINAEGFEIIDTEDGYFIYRKIS